MFNNYRTAFRPISGASHCSITSWETLKITQVRICWGTCFCTREKRFDSVSVRIKKFPVSLLICLIDWCLFWEFMNWIAYWFLYCAFTSGVTFLKWTYSTISNVKNIIPKSLKATEQERERQTMYHYMWNAIHLLAFLTRVEVSDKFLSALLGHRHRIWIYL